MARLRRWLSELSWRSESMERRPTSVGRQSATGRESVVASRETGQGGKTADETRRKPGCPKRHDLAYCQPRIGPIASRKPSKSARFVLPTASRKTHDDAHSTHASGADTLT